MKRQSEKIVRFHVMAVSPSTVRCRSSAANSVRSSLWDAKANKAAGRSVESQRINEKLENIKTNIGKQYQRLCDRDSYVTAEKVRNAFLCMGDDCRLLLQTFDEYLRLSQTWAKTAPVELHDNYRKRRNRLAPLPRIRIPCKGYSFQRAEGADFIESLWSTSPRYKGCVPGRSILHSRS